MSIEKEALKFNIEKNKTITVFFKEKPENKKVIDMIKKGVRVPFNYFNIVKTIDFSIELIYSRREFNKNVGCKTARWVTAHSFGNRFIVFSPSEMEKCTSHDKNEFIQIVSHETSHILLKKLNTDFCTWMNEGIAQNIASQERKEKIDPKNINYFLKECLFKNSNYERFISKQGYEISYKLVKFLMTRYSKKTIIGLLRVRCGFIKSSEREICRILKTDKDKLAAKFKEILKNLR